jgi:hypothetical protein
MLAKAEDLGSKIEERIAEEPQSAGRRLKIANRLLEARLRTERSIVKFTSRGLGAVPIKKVEDEDTDEKAPSFVSLSANRWLVAATVAVAIIAGILFFSTSSEAMLDEDVEVLEAVRLPGGRSLSSAYREGNTLYVVATDAWRAKPAAEKTESVKDLITAPAKKPLFKVLVMDKDGAPLAEMSENGVHVNEIAPEPET